MIKRTALIILLASSINSFAETDAKSEAGNTESIPFGNFNSWITRNVKESAIIGGNTKQLFEVAPTATWNNSNAYTNQGHSPWATSNVMAKVCGITKTNTSVYKESRPGQGLCARLETHIEKCVVLGVINIKVLAAGSIYLGSMQEPITSTSEPMSKISAGIPFSKRPKAICFDYRVKLSGSPSRIKQTGFSSVKKVSGIDMPDCVLYLQKRWEDSKGNIYAHRIGTMVVRFSSSTNGWVNNAKFNIHYGNISNESFFKPYMDLLKGEETKYARNSKGTMTKVNEIGWGKSSETPTHVVLQFDSSHGGAYIGSPGNTLWIDNVRFSY